MTKQLHLKLIVTLTMMISLSFPVMIGFQEKPRSSAAINAFSSSGPGRSLGITSVPNLRDLFTLRTTRQNADRDNEGQKK